MKRTVSVKCLLVLMALMILLASSSFAEDVAGDAKRVTAWGNYCTNIGSHFTPLELNNQTCRMIVTMGISGNSLTIELSNKYGTDSLTLDHITIAPVTEGTENQITAAEVHDVTFGGEQNVTIPARESVESDLVDISVNAGAKYAVSVYVSSPCLASSGNQFNASSYISIEEGDFTASESFDSSPNVIVPFLRNINVITENTDAKAMIILGDSTSSNAWPSLLQERLESCGLENISIIPRSTAGNRLMVDAAMPIFGEGLVNRYERDVLDTKGAFAALIKIGVNDIFQPSVQGTEGFTLDEMIEAEEEIINFLHSKGLMVYMTTVTPFNGYESRGSGNVWSEELEEIRLGWNEWIMTTDKLDGYVDLCPGMADSEDTTRLIEKYTADCLHPSELGMTFIANAIPLEWFTK